ncbi:hypothetical protein JOF56_004180 [Kibdelosporangium banguiense]|uniref:Uncharacterized protein n=1 Tax=Kibdelosporangium banguiense TaxID=1365924 RepID=A0ABS4TIF3_9PSEU|nr:hypothetical protein [Kibdelosporangium banguiense]MBP2323795.1 hypothetical protein [Kibdelosporangium banguiense]
MLATDGDLRSRAALADTEIARLTSAWRTLLAAARARPRRVPSSIDLERHVVENSPLKE